MNRPQANPSTPNDLFVDSRVASISVTPACEGDPGAERTFTICRLVRHHPLVIDDEMVYPNGLTDYRRKTLIVDDNVEDTSTRSMFSATAR